MFATKSLIFSGGVFPSLNSLFHMCVPGGSSRCAVMEAEQRSFPISSLTADRDSDLSGGNSAASSRCSD